MVKYVNGAKLSPELRREALRSYVYRFTAEHRPDWARKEWKDGKPYPVQFASDADWLAHTDFPVTKSGKLASRKDCQSYPTWPLNPELRIQKTENDQ